MIGPTRAFQPSDFKNSCSVGLKTGNGLIGLDIDHYDPSVVQQIRNEAEKCFGVGLARIGQPPKILLLYRCDFITKKQTLKLAPSGKAPEGKSEALEILAKGQQAVVSGIHPETNAPYFWETVEPWDIAAGQLEPSSTNTRKRMDGLSGPRSRNIRPNTKNNFKA